MGIASLFAQSPRAEKVKPPFPSIRLSRLLHNEEAIQALGANLTVVAAWYGKSTEEITRLLRHDRNLWVSPTGRLMYACEMEIPSADGTETASSVTRGPASGLPLDQTFMLHSLLGSKKTIYLDFNGGTISGTAWNASHNNGADIIAAPFDLDGSPSTFSTTELQMIQNIWKRVAEDYAPFDVDVTTEEPAADALVRSSSSDDTFGNRVMITPTNFYPNAGGVSYVGVFDDVGEYYKTSWVFSNMLANGEKFIAEACSHENGHSVGLHHEGTTSGTTYYQGQGDWAPIMGNSYYRNVTQWAKGEYTGANNTEDQLQVMQNYGLEYFADDHGNTATAATQLAVGSTISGSGFIERNTDVDVFRFLAGAGSLSINVAPAPFGPDLKVQADLLDSGGNVLASSSLSTLGASVSATVQAGMYYLSISGVGSGDPATTGYSDYASLGQYVIEGTVVDPGSMKPPTAVIEAAPTTGEAPLAVTFSSSGSTDDGVIVSRAWNFGDGSTSCDPNPSHTFTSAGNYHVTLNVTDNYGLTGSSSVTVIVTKQVQLPRTASPPDFNGDGKLDILWRNSSTGDVLVWYMDGVARIGSASLGSVNVNWRVAGLVDFNGDKKTDILWRNVSTGENYAWYMDGVTVLGGASLPGVSDQNWKIVGVADFNNDGKPDILWRNASTGDNYVWYMDGVTVLGGASLPGVSDQNWKVAGVADFNNDGKPDILWRNVTGYNYVWYMDGVTVLGGGQLPMVADQNWKVAEAEDFNYDGKPDILWRNASTGDNYVWYMDGVTVLGGGHLPMVADQNWIIAP
jgi:PKD repeat protein